MSANGGGNTGFLGKIFGSIFAPLSHHGAEAIAEVLRKKGLEPVATTPPIILLLFFWALSIDPASISAIITALAALSPIWLPLFLLRYFWIMWMHYIRFIYWFKQKSVLLEIQLPAEVTKSPQAMELALTAMWNAPSESTLLQRIWKGQFRPLWSLEIASNEGRIGFYIHMWEQWRNMTEARIYGQYPEAKITQVDDYTHQVNFNLDEYNLFATEYTKIKPQAFPIRTYKDYKLDMNPDTPEIQVDPLTHLLELFGSIGKGEYMWTQIIMKARKSDEWYGFYNTKINMWFDPARAKIKELMAGAAKRAQEVLKQADIVDGKMNALLTEGEKDYIKALEGNLSKLVFECGIRSIYVARRENYEGVNAGGLVRLFDPQRSAAQALNVTRGLIPFDYPWQDFRDILKNRERRKQFFLYQNRAYFYVPQDQSPIFMTPEELATIWHFPSSVVKTPSLNRVESRRAEAPANLPLGTTDK